MEVVSRLNSPVGHARAAGLLEVVKEVQELIWSGFQAWGVAARVCSAHGSDEILWTVLGVGVGVGDDEVFDRLRVSVEATVGTREVVC